MSRKVKIIVIFLIVFIITCLAFIAYSYNRLSPDFFKKFSDTYSEDIQTKPSGFIAEYDYDQFKTFKVGGEFVAFEEKEDEIFPDTSVRFKVGFVDGSGIVHIYPARIGGRSDTGRVMEPVLCRVSETQETCKRVFISEIMETFEEKDSIYLEIIERDVFAWPAAEQTNRYQSVITALKNAIIAGSGFPETPESDDFILQIWVLTKIL